MAKTTIPAAGVALLLAGGVTVAGAAPAFAATPEPMQVALMDSASREETGWLTEPPAGDGWEVIETRTVVDKEGQPATTETTDWLTGPPEDGRTWTQDKELWVVDRPAVTEQGDKTIWVENPDYVPEKTVEVFDHWQRWSLKGSVKDQYDADTPPPSPSEQPGIWTANTPSDSHGVGVAGAYYRNTGESEGSWFYLEAVYRTEVTPAEGEPLIEVENPDYVPAIPEEGHWEYTYVTTTEAVDAVTHVEYRYGRTLELEPVEPPVQPEVDPAKPPVTEEVVTEDVKTEEVEPVVQEEAEPVVAEPIAETLADTGVGDTGLAVAAAGLMAAGGLAVAASRRRQSGTVTD